MNSNLLLYIIILICLVFVVAAVKVFGQKGQAKFAYQKAMSEYAALTGVKDWEKKSAMLFKLYIGVDTLIRIVLEEHGIRSDSIMKQIKSARFDRNLIQGNEYIVLKNFHLKRNKLIHEGEQISPEDSKIMENVLFIVRKLL